MQSSWFFLQASVIQSPITPVTAVITSVASVTLPGISMTSQPPVTSVVTSVVSITSPVTSVTSPVATSGSIHAHCHHYIHTYTYTK